MGLLDSALFGQQGNAGLGGLLQNILQTAQINPTPSAGFDQTQDMSARSQAPLSPQNPFAARAQFTPGMPPQTQQPQMPQAPAQPSQQDAPLLGNSGIGGLGPTLSGLLSFIAPRHTQGLMQQQQLQQQQQALNTSYQALKSSGVPDSVARAAALNPEILKTIAPAYFDTAPKLQKTGTDPLTGQDSFATYSPKNPGVLRPVTTGQPGQAQPVGGSSLFANGVSNVDQSLTGDDYLNQFSPEVKAAVKAYINGDVMPTGNPRQKTISTFAKTIAQKYGQDTGTPVSDALYSQRRMYRSQLGSNTPNSAGGQAKAFNQGIEHMDALASTLEGLKNSNGFGIPFVADAINSGRQMLSTDQSAISDKAKGIGQTLAGEVGKLFSGTAGGGVHERALTMERFSTVKSPAQLGAALEATLEVMKGGLTALQQRRDEVLGPNSDVRFVNPETEKKIARIQEVIDRLKGGSQPAASAGKDGWGELKVN